MIIAVAIDSSISCTVRIYTFLAFFSSVSKSVSRFGAGANERGGGERSSLAKNRKISCKVIESQIQESVGARRINPPVQEAVKLRERRANFDFP